MAGGPPLIQNMKPPQLGITGIPFEGRFVEVEDRVVLDHPFFVLRRFKKRLRRHQPPVLVVAPLSGHFGWLMRDCVAGLLTRHDVCLLEWKDARDVPLAAGRLGLDANIAGIMQAVRALGPGLTVMGVSQAPTALLSAAALMAVERDPLRPRALVLMGGFIDPRLRPTAIERGARALPPGWFSRMLAVIVPDDEPGAGRKVYPGRFHWPALARYLARHMATGGELYRKLTADDGADPDNYPFLKLYSTLMDLPAEFAEDNSAMVFRDALLARGLMTWRGRPIEPSSLEDVALMTIEGESDDSSGMGQTLAAHSLAHRIPDALREHHIAADAGHFGLFHGSTWRDEVLPEVEAFIAHIARTTPNRVRRGRRI